MITSILFKALNSSIEPLAKNSALFIEYTVGNSITKSTPFSIAFFALVHLSIMAGVPLCKKCPLITQIVASEFVLCNDCFK